MASKESKPKISTWTDEESALLLQTVLDYKTAKISLDHDWETVKSKYDDIAQLFISNYPKEKSGEFPNSDILDAFNKNRISAKIKKLKMGYKKAIDSGRKSGGGRAVGSLFEECNEIWAGSPAVEKLDGGLETASVNRDSFPSTYSDSPLGQGSESPTSSQETDYNDAIIAPMKMKMKRKKEELLETLNERRHAKCTKQAPAQEQLLSLAKEDSVMRKEDLELRKKSLELFESAERNFSNSLQQMSKDMAKTITDGFMMIATMFQQQQHQQNVASQHFMPGYQWRYQHADEESSSSFAEL